ncbi:MAG: DUF2029 domain-containing protein [candidate division Zixibacteria bacterium]|nr:DUF2029 domain-containing protein [candidate division Zixibacteria bacterium]MDH3936579.1 DUF2029 domain-containing protein [candidate division Zixibacteria bacterium]
MNRNLLLIVCMVLLIVAAALMFYPDNESPRVLKFVIIAQVMFALSIALFAIGRKFDFDKRDRPLFYIVLVFAVVIRAVMFFGPGDSFWFSDDVYRYVWDGKVASHGVNPYLYSPRAGEVAHLVDTVIHPKINHAWLPTIYPPLAQYVFIAAYQLSGDSAWGFKLISAFFELLTLLVLLVWFRQHGISRSHILLWLFAPLVLIEFYMSAHIDILAMPFLVTTLIAAHDKRAGTTAIMLALATLVKFYGLLFVPYILMEFRGRQRIRFIAVYLAFIVASYLPFAIDGRWAFLGSLFEYLSSWQFNASLFFVFKYVLGLSWARHLAAGLLVLWLVYLFIRRLDLLQRMFGAMAGYIVLTTTLFPWYFVWMYPFLLRNLSPAFVFLSGSVLLSYHVHIGFYATGEWTPIIWTGLVEYIPFYALLILFAVRKRRRSMLDA